MKTITLNDRQSKILLHAMEARIAFLEAELQKVSESALVNGLHQELLTEHIEEVKSLEKYIRTANDKVFQGRD